MEVIIIRVAFQGERGAFSEIIANEFYKDPVLFPCETFKEVFASVNSNNAEVGIIPVENSLTGRIREPTSLLIASKLKIINEGMLRIRHCLISKSENSIEGIERIYAHPEALIQCKEFLSSLDCKLTVWYDGAGASTIVKKEENAGLVASERVAAIYGLKILKSEIQDSKDNTTRFFVISKEITIPSGNDKTSIVFATDHKSGALFNAMEPLVKHKINLTRLESMPVKERPWQYMFLVDLEGHQDDSIIGNALKELEKNTTSLRVLGSYRKGKLYDGVSIPQRT